MTERKLLQPEKAPLPIDVKRLEIFGAFKYYCYLYRRITE
jgi:hypothetical protein